MTPVPPPPHPHGHVCKPCETFWRDHSPQPSPCPTCGNPTPLGPLAELFELAGKAPKTPRWGPIVLRGLT